MIVRLNESEDIFFFIIELKSYVQYVLENEVFENFKIEIPFGPNEFSIFVQKIEIYFKEVLFLK